MLKGGRYLAHPGWKDFIIRGDVLITPEGQFAAGDLAWWSLLVRHRAQAGTRGLSEFLRLVMNHLSRLAVATPTAEGASFARVGVQVAIANLHAPSKNTNGSPTCLTWLGTASRESASEKR